MDRLLIALAAICLSALPLQAKPNIVLILVDDHGYGDLSSFGAKDLQTPHLDALMERGLRSDMFYANCTVCSPTRASLLTGRYPDKAGVPGVVRQWSKDSWGSLDPKAPTLPQYLRNAGYATGMVGKWHLGFESPNTPNDRGFEHFHGFLGDMMDDYYKHRRGGKNWMRLNRDIIEAEGHATDLFSQWSIDYIKNEARNSAPFFLYLAYNAPHFPIQPPDDWLQRVRERLPDLPGKRAKNVAFVEHLDHGIGQVVAAVKEAGIEDNTLIIFSSDNGGSLPHAQSNGRLRGGKQDHWEGGIRVPTCVVWPGKIPAKRSHVPGMTMDLLPTLCEIAGADVSAPVDGQSLTDVWLRDGTGDADRTMIWVRREGNNRYQGRSYYAIRQGKWKLLQNSPFEPMQLIDLEADPFEQHPQAAKGKIADRLRRQLMDHIQSAGRVPWQRP